MKFLDLTKHPGLKRTELGYGDRINLKKSPIEINPRHPLDSIIGTRITPDDAEISVVTISDVLKTAKPDKLAAAILQGEIDKFIDRRTFGYDAVNYESELSAGRVMPAEAISRQAGYKGIKLKLHRRNK